MFSVMKRESVMSVMADSSDCNSRSKVLTQRHVQGVSGGYRPQPQPACS
jgi:hypothetical protein